MPFYQHQIAKKQSRRPPSKNIVAQLTAAKVSLIAIMTRAKLAGHMNLCECQYVVEVVSKLIWIQVDIQVENERQLSFIRVNILSH